MFKKGNKFGNRFKKGNQINKGRKPLNKGKKGVQVAWNKGTKGIMKPNKTSFKKGVTIRLGKHHTKGSKRKMSISRKGIYTMERHPNWQGGISFEPYGIEFNKQLKEFIKNRDSHQCQYKEGSHKGNLTIHHIDYNKQNNNALNLITVCSRHNILANTNREYWMDYFNNKTIIGGGKNFE